MQRNYIPIVKTTDAEIKGYRFLSSGVKRCILPLFELTRSRPVKGFEKGDIYRRMSQLSEYCEGNPFILDLTKHPDLMNDQIEGLLDDTNSFQEWRNFLKTHDELNIIPIIHLYPDNLESYVGFVRACKTRYDTFAFRVSAEDIPSNDLLTYLECLRVELDISERLILILDGEYVDKANVYPTSHALAGLALTALRSGVRRISVNGSSFPASVASYGDEIGRIPVREVEVYNAVASAVHADPHATGVSVIYGDYGGIHPLRYHVMGGGWIPRIDHPLPQSYIYRRYRRDEGGYVRAAASLLEDDLFDAIEDCWGTEQILSAAQGFPEGRSPSFWISVRLNQHITRFARLHC